ncbi:hypothetical protein LDENG_00005110 [Lucifuga dentata]|nr:hypothetical protein LDENG_00005110 [Lucifuga dentata]
MFELQPQTYASERSWVAFIISHLLGRAREWAAAEWERRLSVCPRFHYSLGSFGKFLISPSQDERLLGDFFTCDRDIEDIIKDEWASRELPADLDSLVYLTIRIDNRLTERKKEKAAFSAVSGRQRNRSVTQTVVLGPEEAAGGDSRFSSPRPDFDEPMQVGRTRLSKEECQHCFLLNLCLYCGGLGHRVHSCPLKGETHQ